MTEQASLDALLAGEIPPELREALTFSCPCLEVPECAVCLKASTPQDMGPLGAISQMGHAFGLRTADSKHSGRCRLCKRGRVPLPLDSAHVAAERFIREHHGRVLLGQKVTTNWNIGGEFYYYGEGADIFAAIGAALKGGE